MNQFDAPGMRLARGGQAVASLAVMGWKVHRREWAFVTTLVISAFALVLPGILGARALAGPNHEQAARFASVAGTENYLAFVTIGVIGMTWAGATLTLLSIALQREREQGTLSAIWTGRLAKPLLIVGRAMGSSIGIAVQSLTMFAASWAVFRFTLTLEAGALLLVLGASYAANLAVGVAFAGLVVRYRAAAALSNLAVIASGIFAGVAHPVGVLPEWAQVVAQFVPLTWILRGLRAALVFADAGEAVLSAGVLLLMAFAYGAISIWVFGALERSARRHGVLDAI